MSWYNTKFSGIANKGLYSHQLGELAYRSWSERDNGQLVIAIPVQNKGVGVHVIFVLDIAPICSIIYFVKSVLPLYSSFEAIL